MSGEYRLNDRFTSDELKTSEDKRAQFCDAMGVRLTSRAGLAEEVNTLQAP
jgi:hypothetical protein